VEVVDQIEAALQDAFLCEDTHCRLTEKGCMNRQEAHPDLCKGCSAGKYMGGGTRRRAGISLFNPRRSYKELNKMSGISDLFKKTEKIEREEVTVNMRKDLKKTIDDITVSSGLDFDRVHEILMESGLSQFKRMKSRQK
jgi:hypothetical protein